MAPIDVLIRLVFCPILLVLRTDTHASRRTFKAKKLHQWVSQKSPEAAGFMHGNGLF